MLILCCIYMLYKHIVCGIFHHNDRKGYSYFFKLTLLLWYLHNYIVICSCRQNNNNTKTIKAKKAVSQHPCGVFFSKKPFTPSVTQLDISSCTNNFDACLSLKTDYKRKYLYHYVCNEPLVCSIKLPLQELLDLCVQ